MSLTPLQLVATLPDVATIAGALFVYIEYSISSRICQPARAMFLPFLRPIWRKRSVVQAVARFPSVSIMFPVSVVAACPALPSVTVLARPARHSLVWGVGGVGILCAEIDPPARPEM